MIDIAEFRSMLSAATLREPLAHKSNRGGICYCDDCKMIMRHNSNVDFAIKKLLERLPELFNEFETKQWRPFQETSEVDIEPL